MSPLDQGEKMRYIRCFLSLGSAWTIVVPFLLLMPPLGCARNDQTIMETSGPESEPQVIDVISADRKKKIHEFAEIDGVKFQIPTPWRGNRILEDPPKRSELCQIPVQFTHEGSSIYIECKACETFIQMAEAAREDGIHLEVHSGFRSVRYQKIIFAKLMASGRTWEDLVRYVAPPGYSEHMLGRAVDLYPSDWRFAETKEHDWLLKNAEKYGFYQSYPEKNSLGYPWEAWHWNYRSDERTDDN